MGIFVCCVLLSAGFAGGFLGGAVLERTPAAWLCEYGERPAGQLFVSRKWRILAGLGMALAGWLLWLRLGQGQGQGSWALGGVQNCVGTAAAAGPETLWGSIPAPGDLVAALILWTAAMGVLFLLLLVATADGRRGIIPDQYTAALAFLGLAGATADLRHLWLGQPEKALAHLSFWSPLAGPLLCGGAVLLLSLLAAAASVPAEGNGRREAIGFGDIKLFAALGLLFGPRGGLTMLLLSFALSGLAFTLLLLTKKVRREDSKPFGPYIALSGALYLCL